MAQSIRRALIACLTVALAFTGFAVRPAEAAEVASVDGVGSGESTAFWLDEGIYLVDFAFQDAVDALTTSSLTSTDSGVDELLTFSMDASGSTRRVVRVTEADLFRFSVVSSEGVRWSGDVSPADLPTSAQRSFAASGQGLSSSEIYLLQEGTYSYTAAFSGNELQGIPYTITVSAIDHASDAAHVLLQADATANGTRSGTFTVARQGLVWLSPSGTTTSGANWSVDAALVEKKAFSAAPTPAVSGTAQVGKTLTATPGTWQPSPASLTYQWLRDGAKISGATKPTYTATASDKGKKLSVTVTAAKPDYVTTSKTSAATAAVAAGSLSSTPTPKISGTAQVGKKLTASAGTWKPSATLTYQWLRDGKKISGATKSSYTLTSSDKGKKISVQVKGAKSGYTSVTKTSSKTKAVKAGTLSSTPTPTISGTAQVGKKLTAKAGTWKPSGVKLSYQWLRSGKTIKGATASTYKVGAADKGKKISVKVKGSKSGYTSVTKTSKSTKTVTYPSRTAPVSLTSCPSWAPIKGNADSGIYHVKGQRFYTRTHPEECFSSESAARAAGYRKSKV
ncbi:MAG: hypothetical protein QM713_10600 [Arachnia sp.]